jgi:hypothetical protein
MNNKITYNIHSYAKDKHHPTFTIGHQTFHLMECEAKADAKWFIKMLKIAFEKLQAKK